MHPQGCERPEPSLGLSFYWEPEQRPHNTLWCITTRPHPGSRAFSVHAAHRCRPTQNLPEKRGSPWLGTDFSGFCTTSNLLKAEEIETAAGSGLRVPVLPVPG